MASIVSPLVNLSPGAIWIRESWGGATLGVDVTIGIGTMRQLPLPTWADFAELRMQGTSDPQSLLVFRDNQTPYDGQDGAVFRGVAVVPFAPAVISVRGVSNLFFQCGNSKSGNYRLLFTIAISGDRKDFR